MITLSILLCILSGYSKVTVQSTVGLQSGLQSRFRQDYSLSSVQDKIRLKPGVNSLWYILGYCLEYSPRHSNPPSILIALLSDRVGFCLCIATGFGGISLCGAREKNGSYVCKLAKGSRFSR